MHLQQTTDTLFLVLSSIVYIRTRLKRTRVNTQVSKLTNEGVGHDLECQCCKRSLRICRTFILFTGLRVGTLNCRYIAWSRKVINNCVQKFLNTLILVSGANKYWVDLAVDYAFTDSCLKFFNGNFFFHENFFHQIIVAVSCCFEKFLMIDFSIFLKFSWDFIHRLWIGHTLIVCLEVPCGHGNQVNNAPEVVLSTHRKLSSNCFCVKTITHGLNCMEEVCTYAVILVDERNTRNAITFCLTPNGFRLRLYTSNSVKNSNGTVKNAKGAFYLSGKVNVAGCVDNLEAIFFAILLPEAGGSCSGNGYAALLFLNHPVHRSCTVMNLTNFVGLTGVVQNTFGGSGLTGIDVCHDAEVTSVVKRCFCHI